MAQIYDTLCTGRPDADFYLDLIMRSRSVLDVGCGTGAFLRAAREAGHPGRLCGLDPSEPMLEVARARGDIEWVCADVSAMHWRQEFDLIIMTGHAFQFLVDDAQIAGALEAIRRALAEDGRFVFETRNPLRRAWERWTSEYQKEIKGPNGEVIQVRHDLESVEGDTVTFTETMNSASWEKPSLSRSSLRFLDRPSLAQFIADAGLKVDHQYGNFDLRPFEDDDDEIITVASRK
ncbi:class I SAM-dependent methyltransferase [Natronoglycomyces albus]|uniref:Class I SAM-dependent methyltransferase n=1 Tax=Natronoglycomyces albus TaxID=2811108 RepID=A0A895XRG3_9ACTN|nr:class I SAM-dependent methyltransferase [Natronoglycomyces albus]QSB04198.1 class I SAM-dependent methyltransferase [Natronoglycomyces albus]